MPLPPPPAPLVRSIFGSSPIEQQKSLELAMQNRRSVPRHSRGRSKKEQLVAAKPNDQPSRQEKYVTNIIIIVSIVIIITNSAKQNKKQHLPRLPPASTGNACMHACICMHGSPLKYFANTQNESDRSSTEDARGAHTPTLGSSAIIEGMCKAFLCVCVCFFFYTRNGTKKTL